MMTVPRLASLEELNRQLAASFQLLREIDTARTLARLHAEDPARWELVVEAFRLAQAPDVPGSLSNLRRILGSALDL
jgi:hypothetical protein